MHEKKEASLFSVLSSLEEDLLEVERARDILTLYGEGMERELGALKEVIGAPYLLRCFNVLQAVLEAAQCLLYRAAASMESDIERGYEAQRREAMR